MFPIDKLWHFGVGLLLGLALGCNLPVACLVVIIVATTKEVYDHFFHGDVEALDFIATLAGGIAGILITQGIVYLIQKVI